MRNVQIGFSLGILVITGIITMGTAQAVPSFATKYEKNCSYCHNAWPQLNNKGRKFKEQGYRFKEELEAEGKTTPYYEAGNFPISALIVSRPYDKADNGNRMLRAIHEVELFIAGTMGKNISIFSQISAEDETGFSPEVSSTALSYRFNKTATLQMTWSQANWADGYGLLGNHFRLTRGSVGIIDQDFGGADGIGGKLRSKRQNIAMTGRIIDEKLFYNIGLGGVAENVEGISGNNPGDGTSINARIAFDVKKNIMVGGYILNGETNNMDFRRTVIDTQTDLKNIRIQAAYAIAEDNTLGGTETNNAFSIQAYNIIKTKKGMPTWVQLVRVDNYEKNNGSHKYNEFTLNVTHYLTQNIKAYIEYWDRFDTPTGINKNNRLTLQLYVGL